MARCRPALVLALAILAASAAPATARIAFVSERDGEPEIYVMADDGSGQADLSNDPGQPDLAPAWSPDGSEIAYQRGFGSDGDIWVMHADGSGGHAIVTSDGGDQAPAWAPDGRHIAYISDVSGQDELYVSGADGSAPRALDTGDADPADPAYSPDGTKIAYWDADAQLIKLVGTDGGNDHDVGGPPPDALGGDQTPAWTPDGSRLVFASLRTIDSSYDIWSMALDGSDQRALTSSPDREIDPSVGPDGRIAYAGDTNGDYDIYVMNADGSGPTRLTSADGDDTAPAWAPAPAGGSGASPTAPGAATKTTPASKTTPARLVVRADYAHASVRFSRHLLVARIPYTLNRPAKVTIHLLLHGRLRGVVTSAGGAGANVAVWRHRISSPARWRGTFEIRFVRAAGPPAAG